MSKYIVAEMRWTQRCDLRELAVQTLNFCLKCEYSFRSHVPHAVKHGISTEQQAAIPYWQTTKLFDEEQRLVIEYTIAVVSSEVPEELFRRVRDRYGDRGATEFTAAVAWWSFWAMIINAVRPEFFEPK